MVQFSSRRSCWAFDLAFSNFDVEPGSSANLCDFDYLEIYDGSNIGATLIDRYCNNNIPTTAIN